MRSKRDWSSDVCSSDLDGTTAPQEQLRGQRRHRAPRARDVGGPGGSGTRDAVEIGRASCRERVWIAVVAGSLRKKRVVRRLYLCGLITACSKAAIWRTG